MALQLASPRLRQLQVEVANSEQRLRNSIPLLAPQRRRKTHRRRHRLLPLSRRRVYQRPLPRRRLTTQRRRRVRTLTVPVITDSPNLPLRRSPRTRRVTTMTLPSNV